MTEDSINITLNSEQADLIVSALREFRMLYIERSLMDNDSDTPKIRRNLDMIDQLSWHLKSEIAKIYNEQQIRNNLWK